MRPAPTDAASLDCASDLSPAAPVSHGGSALGGPSNKTVRALQLLAKLETLLALPCIEDAGTADEAARLIGGLRDSIHEREREHFAADQHAIVSIADRNGTIVYVNDKFCKVSGYPRDELVGANHRIVKSDRHEPGFYRDMWDTIASGRVWQGEVCNRARDGSLYWVETTITPFLDSDGIPYQYVSIRTDITHVKLAENELRSSHELQLRTTEALRVSEERLRRSQIYANIGTWDWNVQTGELYWSDRIAPLFGYPEGELETSYENFLAAVHPDDRQRVVDAVKACVARGAPYDIEHRCMWPDGAVRWLHEQGDVVRDAQGAPLHMLGVVQDITDRKLAESMLREREHLLSAILTTTRQGFWFIDGNGLTTEVNPAMCAILGRSRDELLGSTIFDFVDADNARIFEHQLERRRMGITEPYELALSRPDGTLVPCINTPSILTDESGNRIGSVGIWTDISELKNAQQNLARLNETLVAAREGADRANQAKSEFLARMSHELRTPMNAIIGFGQILEHDDTLGAEQRDSVHEIIKAGRHLLTLINEVLDLAKVESGRIELSLEPIEVGPLIEECLSLMRPLAMARCIELRRACEPGIAVRADATRLKQVLLNLLSNAIKYNAEGGEVCIEIEVREGDLVRIAVTDTGYGIPQERAEEVFQPFNRLGAEGGEEEGTGIGLTICRRIVEMMGGSIMVESSLGMGSRFCVDMPLADAAARPDPGGECLSGTGVADVDSSPPRTVMYIEDNPANLKLVSQLLGKRPQVRLLTAHTADLGLELAAAHRPDLILLDINLPGMSGYEVLKVLRSDRRLKHIPVIAVTAIAMPREIERGMKAGFADYLVKPLDLPRFLETVDRCLREAA
ncbi:MAG TPA: PAS domain S-box protein [Rhodocyclaceae bacterium]|nr:PAS domain S-box protein [Rhodocyclaceae bacterium]